ncbi:MAG TPA: DRTGG domain-containing protein [Syntrophales bacterium]|nr:DRTGG domain-containing protein [Syntrophales bacterium]
MYRLVVTSMHPNAGKTSIIIGLAKALNKKLGYIKPFGDRLLYRKKRLWDYDSALMNNIFSLGEDPAEMSIGFDHARLVYIFDKETITKKVRELEESVGKDVDILFAESGKELSYGVSVYLDAISITKALAGELVVVISGKEDTIIDDISFLKSHVNLGGANFKGIIINKVPNLEDFTNIHLPKIKQLGINVLGVIPYYDELPRLTVNFLADRLFAKVISGESYLNRPIKNVIVGSMAATAAVNLPVFKEESKVVITSGDRDDMISAALEGDTAAVVLTCNVEPTKELIKKATDRKIPLLLVSPDTYQIAKQIDSLEPLLQKEDADKILLLEQMIKKHVNLQEFQRS